MEKSRLHCIKKGVSNSQDEKVKETAPHFTQVTSAKNQLLHTSNLVRLSGRYRRPSKLLLYFDFSKLRGNMS